MLNSKMLLPAKTVLHLGSMWMWSSFTLITHNLSTKMYAQQQQNALLFFFYTYLIVSTPIWVLTKLSFLPKVQTESAICLCGTSPSSAPTRSPSSAGFQIMTVCLRWTTWHLLIVTVTQGKKKKEIKLLIGVFKYKSVLIGHMSQDSILHSIHMWSQ